MWIDGFGYGDVAIFDSATKIWKPDFYFSPSLDFYLDYLNHKVIWGFDLWVGSDFDDSG